LVLILSLLSCWGAAFRLPLVCRCFLLFPSSWRVFLCCCFGGFVLVVLPFSFGYVLRRGFLYFSRFAGGVFGFGVFLAVCAAYLLASVALLLAAWPIGLPSALRRFPPGRFSLLALLALLFAALFGFTGPICVGRLGGSPVWALRLSFGFFFRVLVSCVLLFGALGWSPWFAVHSDTNRRWSAREGRRS